MRMANNEIATEIRQLLEALGPLSQARFVHTYGRKVGIKSEPSLSRILNGSRTPTRGTLEKLVALFPQHTRRIAMHLADAFPRVEHNAYRMTINQVDEGFLLDIESRVRIELDEYLFAYCDSADAERELRNRLPGLFGLEIVKINSNIAAEIDQIEQSDARTYIVRDHLGIPTQHHYEPRRLTDDEIRARGFDISDELLTSWSSGQTQPRSQNDLHIQTDNRRCSLPLAGTPNQRD